MSNWSTVDEYSHWWVYETSLSMIMQMWPCLVTSWLGSVVRQRRTTETHLLSWKLSSTTWLTCLPTAWERFWVTVGDIVLLYRVLESKIVHNVPTFHGCLYSLDYWTGIWPQINCSWSTCCLWKIHGIPHLSHLPVLLKLVKVTMGESLNSNGDNVARFYIFKFLFMLWTNIIHCNTENYLYISVINSSSAFAPQLRVQ